MSTTSSATAPRLTPGQVVGGGLAAGLVVLLAALLYTGSTVPLVLGDPGPIVRWGLPVFTLIWQVAAVTTVGLLGLAAFLMPERGTTDRRATALTYAVRAGAVWVTTGAIALLLTFADIVGAPPTSGQVLAQFGTFVFSLDITRVPAISVLTALVVTVGASVARARSTMVWLTGLGLFAIVVNALTGHAANAVGHEEAVNAMGFHLLGIAVWVGGLIGLVIMRPHLTGRGHDGDLAVTVERYSVLALWAYVAVALSGMQSAWLRVGGLEGVTTAYGLLVLLKMALLAGLGVLGWRQRRAVIARLRSSSTARGAFARLAAIEVLLMVTATSLGVALSRTAPPDLREVPETDIVTTLTGFPDPGPATSAADWFLTWRIDWLFLTIALVAIGLYVAGYIRLLRRGDHWPWLRTASWIVGWLLFVYATNGAPGVWGRVLFSTHMVMHMMVAMFVPLLLVPGAPVTLALRTLKARKDKTWGPRELILRITHSRANRILTNPVVAATLFFVSLAIFYYSPAFELSLTTHTGHLLMMAHFLLTGYLFTWVLIGIDPGPRKWNPVILLTILFVTISFHAFFGVILTGTDSLLAPGFYGQLNLPWLTDPLADQYTAGEIAWGVGEAPTLILALIVARNWVKSDRVETRRKDRQADRDGGVELAAYNEMLAERRRQGERMGG
ncbi:MAG: cytochrome c oxidase assembly protein [Dermatophilaceae bacterium]|nr:bifunctional copper resistance protein CopD/cytochrome c oxidase assembly protein [Intrasporangiaceae bacterium]